MNTPSLLPVAVPSWITPGTAAENARFLAGQPRPSVPARIVEMGLCCFETAASLACTRTDYPSASPDLALHVHLPVDLAWAQGLAPQQVLALMERLAPCGVRRAVLHPPASGPQGGGADDQLTALMSALVSAWSAAGHAPEDMLLENHRDLTAADLLCLVDRLPVSVCLDVAHMWTYGQHDLFSRLDPRRVKLLHWSAPGPVPGKDAHLPLTRLSEAEREAAHEVAARFAAALPLVEVFSWAGIADSLPVLLELYGLHEFA